MSSFSIAKKITEDDIKKYFANHKNSGKSEKEIGDMLRQKIMNDIQEAIQTNVVPGLVSNEEVAKELGLNANVVKNMPELTRLIMVIAHKLVEKNYDKMSLCYFINGLVNVLGLAESDFEKFHRENKIGDDDDDGDDDEYRDA
jgi:hypothetical protein